MQRRRGFTLLEVMMATAVLAVGTVSVLMVFGTALSFAHRRQGMQQLTQVLAEARTDARSLVNNHRPGNSAAPAAKAPPKGGKSAPSGMATPAGATPDTNPKSSTVFAAYTYTIHFEPVRREAPESGWRAAITVKWGDAQSHVETMVLTPDVIPDEEFGYSLTYQEQRQGEQEAKTRETR